MSLTLTTKSLTGTENMTQSFKNSMSELMKGAWRMVRNCGYTMSEAMHVCWMNLKLKKAMKTRVVQFFYIKKSTGELRQAFGTTDPHRYDYQPTGGRTGNFADCVQYWDMTSGGFRMYKDYNLVRICL